MDGTWPGLLAADSSDWSTIVCIGGGSDSADSVVMDRDPRPEAALSSAESTEASLFTDRGETLEALGLSVFGLLTSHSRGISSIGCRSTGKYLMVFCNEVATSAFSPSGSDSYDVRRVVSWVSRDSRCTSITPRALDTLLCSRLFTACNPKKVGVCVTDIRKTAHLAFLSCVPRLPIKYADSAYIVPVELLDHPVPPKNVTVLVGGGRKVQPLRDKSAIADGWTQSIPNSSRDAG